MIALYFRSVKSVFSSMFSNVQVSSKVVPLPSASSLFEAVL